MVILATDLEISTQSKLEYPVERYLNFNVAHLNLRLCYNEKLSITTRRLSFRLKYSGTHIVQTFPEAALSVLA